MKRVLFTFLLLSTLSNLNGQGWEQIISGNQPFQTAFQLALRNDSTIIVHTREEQIKFLGGTDFFEEYNINGNLVKSHNSVPELNDPLNSPGITDYGFATTEQFSTLPSNPAHTEFGLEIKRYNTNFNFLDSILLDYRYDITRISQRFSFIGESNNLNLYLHEQELGNVFPSNLIKFDSSGNRKWEIDLERHMAIDRFRNISISPNENLLVFSVGRQIIPPSTIPDVYAFLEVIDKDGLQLSADYIPFKSGSTVPLSVDFVSDSLVVIASISNIMLYNYLSRTIIWHKDHREPLQNEYHGVIKNQDGGFLAYGQNDVITNEPFFYLQKLNANGDTLWNRDFPNLTFIRKVIQCPDENFIILGETENQPGISSSILIKTDSIGPPTVQCDSDAGQYPPDDILLCATITGGGLFTAPLPTNLFLDANDGIDYIQFTDPLDPLNSMVRSSVGSTTEPTDILVFPATGTNSIYFAAVVADRKPDGRLDKDDPCLSISSIFKIIISDLTCSIDAEITNGCFTTQSKLVANVTGGTPPYEYLWNTGSTEDSIAIFGAGAFLVTITDAVNCTSRCLVTLPDPLPFEVLINDFCKGDSIPMFLQGIPPFNGYLIPTTDLGVLDTIFYNDLLVQSNSLSPDILSFDYNFIDKIGCTTEGTIDSLSQAELVCDLIFSDDTLSCLVPQIAVQFFCSGGTPPYQYSVNGTFSPNSFTLIDQPGTYLLTINDSKGCITTETFDIELDNSSCGSISGIVLLDQEDDCLLTSTDTPLDCWIVQASNMTNTFFATTQPDGSYALPVAPGTYDVELLSPNPLYGICNNNQQVTVVDTNDIVNANFLVNALFECPLMEVSVGSFRPRRCFSGSMPIEYCNNGTIAADDVSIELILDPLIEINNANLPFTTNGDTVFFEIGTVQPFDCEWFFIEYEISCDAVLNQTLCAEAIIFPNDPCPAPDSLWSGASLSISGECTGDSIHFTITNVGTGTMNQARQYIVIEDAAIMRISNPFTLGAGGETKGSVPTTGSTIRIEVPQEANHPGQSMPSITIEHCGTGPFSSGFVTQLPLDDADTFVDIQCEEVRGSFDPNDKQAEPKGFDSEHFIEPNTDLEYTIRFQNTGNDTAFTVEIIDTLSNLLDVGSVNPGVSSHDYRFEVFETGILRFKFNDILLVDSFTNEPASNGFVKYSIAQKEDVPLGSVIYNAADIYFDFNDPIHTNQTFHTVGRDFITVKTQEVFVPGATVKVYPNPFNDKATFELKNVAEGRKTLRLLDISGKVIYSQTVNNEQLILERNNLRSGFYFYEILGEGAKIAVGKLVVE